MGLKAINVPIGTIPPLVHWVDVWFEHLNMQQNTPNPLGNLKTGVATLTCSSQLRINLQQYEN